MVHGRTSYLKSHIPRCNRSHNLELAQHHHYFIYLCKMSVQSKINASCQQVHKAEKKDEDLGQVRAGIKFSQVEIQIRFDRL